MRYFENTHILTAAKYQMELKEKQLKYRKSYTWDKHFKTFKISVILLNIKFLPQNDAVIAPNYKKILIIDKLKYLALKEENSKIS